MLTYLDPLSIKGLALANVLRLAQRLGASVLGQTTLVRQARKSGRKSSQEADESSGMHFDGCC